MSKIFVGVHGSPLSTEEDEKLNRWKHLQNHSREIVRNAISMVEATDGLTKLSAQLKLQAAVKDYIRLGGPVDDVKYFL
jgi:hypothetical protein